MAGRFVHTLFALSRTATMHYGDTKRRTNIEKRVEKSKGLCDRCSEPYLAASNSKYCLECKDEVIREQRKRYYKEKHKGRYGK